MRGRTIVNYSMFGLLGLVDGALGPPIVHFSQFPLETVEGSLGPVHTSQLPLETITGALDVAHLSQLAIEVVRSGDCSIAPVPPPPLPPVIVCPPEAPRATATPGCIVEAADPAAVLDDSCVVQSPNPEGL